MTLDFTLVDLLLAIVALAVGVAIGRALGSAARQRARTLTTANAALLHERDEAAAARDRALADIRARDAQIRPLSDEIDRLRRELARAKAAPAPATDAASPGIDLANLRLLKGVGPKFAERLAAAGITRIDALAALSEADVAALDPGLDDFAGRLASDRLVEQAGLLSAGRLTEYETRFGKLGG